MLDEKEVRHVAKLARIKITDEEAKKFAGQLSKVLGYIKILEEVDTENVSETSQVTGLENVFEEDEVIPSQSSREELLNCSELPIDSKHIRVKRSI
ncbi:MAG: Asp-tRNA(Asn)/Glu-tRNA(Gln) amidotransferase subunit GatC [bacterium]|nr:Asp-tRNA(Asn)/Glu-tRNA(Gln) amidotransferase subunit GatC [bacterium]